MDSMLDNSSQDEKRSHTRKAPWMIRLWHKSGLNPGMLAMMLKGALAPTIAIALYQSTSFADHYSTLGYLVAVMSILSFVIMPRAKFFQTMLFNIIGICIDFCITLLSIYCSVQARAHTTTSTSNCPQSSSGGPSPDAAVAPYKSSASAVCAIWLFFSIYVSNALKNLLKEVECTLFATLSLPAFLFSDEAILLLNLGHGEATTFDQGFFPTPVHGKFSHELGVQVYYNALFGPGFDDARGVTFSRRIYMRADS
ncbi:MAG: hypothetical protein Q9198_004095 [Flavoplaca austrocitrina]